jgi:ABC-2 type transport system ATP-binding protein
MSDPNAMIAVDGVSKSYPTGFFGRRVRVLSDLSFGVGRNEIVGFLGPNGAGKTTTIKILNGLAFPDAGTVTIFGERAGTRQQARRHVGFMPEQPYFYEYLTGLEFLSLCGHLTGMRRGAIVDRSKAMLARVGLSGAGEAAVRKYSKGMMQRLALAQALLHDPELLILDEPMSGLDPLGRMEFRALIRDMKASGKTVFFSSHIISDVEALCDRVVMLDRGSKVAEGTLDELLGSEGIQYVELLFSPPPDRRWLADRGLVSEGGSLQGGGVTVRAKDLQEANALVDAFRAAGSLVRSFTPVKRRLEDVYVRQVAGGEADEALRRSFQRNDSPTERLPGDSPEEGPGERTGAGRRPNRRDESGRERAE